MFARGFPLLPSTALWICRIIERDATQGPQRFRVALLQEGFALPRHCHRLAARLPSSPLLMHSPPSFHRHCPHCRSWRRAAAASRFPSRCRQKARRRRSRGDNRQRGGGSWRGPRPPQRTGLDSRPGSTALRGRRGERWGRQHDEPPGGVSQKEQRHGARCGRRGSGCGISRNAPQGERRGHNPPSVLGRGE